MAAIGLTVEAIHAHVLALQERFLAQAGELPLLAGARLITPMETRQRGHFLTFELAGAGALHDRLAAAHIMTDVRGDRIRFGLGCYHNAADIDAAVERMATI